MERKMEHKLSQSVLFVRSCANDAKRDDGFLSTFYRKHFR